jgi:hypothetical protein
VIRGAEPRAALGAARGFDAARHRATVDSMPSPSHPDPGKTPGTAEGDRESVEETLRRQRPEPPPAEREHRADEHPADEIEPPAPPPAGTG